MAEFEPLTEKDKSIYDIVKNLDIQYAEIIRPDKPFRVISASDKMKNFNGNRYFVCIAYKDNPYFTIILNNEYNKAFNNITGSFYQDVLVLSDYLNNDDIDAIVFLKTNIKSEDKDNEYN